MEIQTGITTFIILGCLAMFCLIIVIILFVVTYQRKMLLKESRIKIMDQEKQIDLFKAAVEAEEQQKEKIARNLHDEINPLLSALKFNLSKHRIRAKKNEFEPDSLLQDEETLDKAIEGIRTTCYDLIPSFFLQYGLVPSLEEYVRNVQQIDELSAVFSSDVIPEELETFEKQEQLNIYRICLEILNNLLKHSHCTIFELSIISKNNQLVVKCTHNGKGVTNQEMEMCTDNSKGFGLKSIKARALLLKAKIDYIKSINSASIILSIPLNEK